MRGRYGLVLVTTVAVLIITIALPEGERTGGAVIVLEGLVLLAALWAAPPTSGGRLVRIAVLLGALAGLAAVFGGVPGWLVLSASAAFLGAAIAALTRGAANALETEGVTARVVSAALALYLIAGLLYATVISAVAGGTDASYFASGTDGTWGDRVYFSFATLTTTGFGDLTPALPIGRALAVSEMLIGQIYLVTIVAMLVGNMRGRRAHS